MIVKKIAAVAGAGALLLSVASPAFADDDLNIRNRVRVRNNVTTQSNTGLNAILAADDVRGGRVRSGNAEAVATVATTANTSSVDDRSGFDDTTVRNRARVTNNVTTQSNSGLNSILAADDVRGGRVRSGNAVSDSMVTNVVNTTVID
jgi:hypothetical protein